MGQGLNVRAPVRVQLPFDLCGQPAVSLYRELQMNSREHVRTIEINLKFSKTHNAHVLTDTLRLRPVFR